MAYTTIDNPELYFQTKIYTGDGVNGRSLTLDGDENMQPDLVWTKCRSHAVDHGLQDSVRGVAKVFHSNSTTAEGTDNWITSLDSDGFTLSNSNEVNQDTRTFVAWCWKESADAGFDICSWTGNGSAQNISHNLSKVPTMIIVKNRTDTTDWYCYNVHNGNTHSILLNSTGAKVGAYSDNWNNTTPTSSVFTVGSSNSTGGSSSDNMIAYVFTDIQGYSKFGSYTGNGNADGTFVFCGFQPAWVMFKPDASADWTIVDNKRNTFNVVKDKTLNANLNNAEHDGSMDLDFLSNGFKIRNANTDSNHSGTIIYMAFAEAPFVNSNGVPCNAR